MNSNALWCQAVASKQSFDRFGLPCSCSYRNYTFPLEWENAALASKVSETGGNSARVRNCSPSRLWHRLWQQHKWWLALLIVNHCWLLEFDDLHRCVQISKVVLVEKKVFLQAQSVFSLRAVGEMKRRYTILIVRTSRKIQYCTVVISMIVQYDLNSGMLRHSLVSVAGLWALSSCSTGVVDADLRPRRF